MVGYAAPAGTPITVADLIAGLGSGVRPDLVGSRLTTWLAGSGGRHRAWTLSSGRAAMSLVLTAMKNLVADENRDEVILPAYTCYSVPAAVERAGLRPRLCDIDPATLDFDYDALERLDSSRALAIVSANLYGIPNNLPSIEDFARRRGILMLDDAAQSLGATVAGRPAGGFGAAGLFSFDKGKNITTIQGGAVVADDGPLAKLVDQRIRKLPPMPTATTYSLTLQLCAYALLLHPVLYSLVRQLPFLGLGQTRYELACPVTRLSAVLEGVANRLASRLATIAEQRRRNAAEYLMALGTHPALSIPASPPGSKPVYTRFPILVRDLGHRQPLLEEINARGIGASPSYPRALPDVPEVARRMAQSESEFRGARHVAERIITLPTHAYCPPDIARTTTLAIERVLASLRSVQA